MRRTKTLSLTSVVPISESLCRLLSVPAGRWPFPTLSLQSLYRCLDPYPAVSLRCTYPFLPEEHWPHFSGEKFGTHKNRRSATSATHAFRSCSHSIMFRLPYSLDPQVAPTAAYFAGQPDRVHHAMDMRLPIMNCGIATYPKSGKRYDGTFTR
jgi:hypothetical protein